MAAVHQPSGGPPAPLVPPVLTWGLPSEFAFSTLFLRRAGQPRTVWADTILPIIQKHLQLTRDQIYDLAQNREEWFRETERLCRLLSQELQA